MLKSTLSVAVILLIVGFGCSDTSPDVSSVVSNSSLSYTVDPESGIDSDTYNSSYGFKTISFALDYINNNYPTSDEYFNIFVRSGIYSEENGEIFPMILKNKVHLYGESGVVIENNDIYLTNVLSSDHEMSVTIIMDDYSSVSNISINSINGETLGLVVRSGFPSIKDNEITGNSYGIVTMSSSSPSIERNTIERSDVAVEIQSDSKPSLHDNVLLNNNGGILVLNDSKPTIGTQEEPGRNEFTNNLGYDLCNASPNVIDAVGNYWEQGSALITLESSCGNGEVVGNIGGGSVNIVFVPEDDTPILRSGAGIEIISPYLGEITSNDRPYFSWNMLSTKLVAMGVFDQRIEVSGNEITNREDVVFYWDSGMSTGRVGSIIFDDGRLYSDGNLIEITEDSTLDKGRTYFWAIWSWDEEGIYIQNSSREGYFTIVN